MTLAIVRIRGDVATNQDIRDTLRMLRLTRQNHLVLVASQDTLKGMLQKVKDYVTWGEPDAETLAKVIQAKGRAMGDRPLTDEYIKANSAYASAREFATAVTTQKARFTDLKDVKPVIRLHPPRGGYENTKRAFRAGGSLGYRGQQINQLILRMLGPGAGHFPAKRPPGKRGLKGGAPDA